nr:SDR family NAD(P)-dependent oxidoreductase [uncultured Cohaesibacter sp.]
MVRRCILISGASRGLGAALAQVYASPDTELILTARSMSSLDEIKRSCERAGSLVHCLVLDLQSRESIDLALSAICTIGLPDLIISNAGVYSGRKADGNLESWVEQQQQLTINLTQTIYFIGYLANLMKRRQSGHLVLISSLAAIQPQPDSPAYSASKAGLAAWGRALGEDLADFGVKMSVVYPGHIMSQQTAIHKGALPGIMTPQRAAQIISRRIGKRERVIFPRYLYWLICLSNSLPSWLRRRVNKPFRYHIDNSSEGDKE